MEHTTDGRGSGPALFDAMPAASERVPWCAVGSYPTAVERVEGLAPTRVELWVKREDRCSDAYGGNKVRKLEFLFAEARTRGASRLVAFGAYNTHHGLATAVHGRRMGFDVDVVVFPEPLDARVRENLRAIHAAGATLVPVPNVAAVLPHRWAAERSRDAMWTAAGGSSVTGALGWASAGFELLAQVRDGALPRPDVVYAPLGSGGTVAGLLWSLWSSPAIELVAVDTVRPRGWAQLNARALVRGLERRLGSLARGARAGEAPTLRVERPIDAPEETLVAAARAGLALDRTYTGATLGVLLRDAREGRLDGRRALFVDTFSSADLGPLIAGGRGADSMPEPLLRALGM